MTFFCLVLSALFYINKIKFFYCDDSSCEKLCKLKGLRNSKTGQPGCFCPPLTVIVMFCHPHLQRIENKIKFIDTVEIYVPSSVENTHIPANVPSTIGMHNIYKVSVGIVQNNICFIYASPNVSRVKTFKILGISICSRENFQF